MLKPNNFELRVIDEARRLYHGAVAQSSATSLDNKTSMWVIRRDAWRDLLIARDYMTYLDPGFNGPKRLLGLPVRITIEDEADVPMIQLVMEPMMRARS